MKVEDIKTVAVIGAGDMGHGIAEVALIADYRVYLLLSSFFGDKEDCKDGWFQAVLRPR